jgi:hypothetical protein
MRLIRGWDDGSETRKAMAAFGVRIEGEVGDPLLSLWPENQLPLEVFDDMLTSWNVGPGGVIGLRWEALPTFLEGREMPRGRRELIDALKVMEQAAIGHWNRESQ